MTNVCTDNQDNSIRDVMYIFNAMKIGEATAWALTIAARCTSNIYLSIYEFLENCVFIICIFALSNVQSYSIFLLIIHMEVASKTSESSYR